MVVEFSFMQLWDLPPTFLLAVSWGLFPDSRVFLAYDFFCPSSQLAMMGQISLAHWSLTTNCVLLLLGIPLDPFNNPGYPPCFEVSWSAVSVHSICAVSFVKWLKYTGSRAEEDRYWVITLGTWSKEELELKVTKANVSAHQKQKTELWWLSGQLEEMADVCLGAQVCDRVLSSLPPF